MAPFSDLVRDHHQAVQPREEHPEQPYGYPLAHIGSSCPDYAPVKCEEASTDNLNCCPGHLVCRGVATTYCLPPGMLTQHFKDFNIDAEKDSLIPPTRLV